MMPCLLLWRWRLAAPRFHGVLTLLTDLSGCETFWTSHTWYNDVIL